MQNADAYIEAHTTPATAAMDAAERWAHLHTAQPQMVCGPQVGLLLRTLCRATQARCAVEVGTFVGYSTLCIAQGLASGGRLHTFEVNDELETPIRRHLQAAGVSDRVTLHLGDACVLIPTLFNEKSRIIDLAFIDAGKRQNRDCYELLLPRMRQGGLIVVDNTLWYGKVLVPERDHDTDTHLIHSFNEWVQQDPRVENLMLNLRDGILICSVL